ncbi:MAG: hypothetical protein JSS20_21290 [Proteobacteria bacterium]|nr:hypothetical protein [Pseudomonadota bacterium]
MQGIALANTGGVAGFMATYWAAVQQNALRAQRDHALPEDFPQTRDVPALRKQLGLIKGLASRDPKQLTGIRDVPYDAFGARWFEQQKAYDLAHAEASNQDDDEAPRMNGQHVDVSAPRIANPRYKRVQTQAKAQKTRAEKQSDAAAKRFESGDLRNGTAAALQAGFHALRQEQEGAGNVGDAHADDDKTRQEAA